MNDIDRIAEAMVTTLAGIGAFENAETPIRDFALAAKIKMESLRSDPDIFDIWPQLVTSAERLTNLAPVPKAVSAGNAWPRHSFSDGQQLIRNGRDLIFYIAQARTPMPKSTREYIERCESYLDTGRVQLLPGSLPA